MTCRHRTFLDRIKPQAVASPLTISSQVVPSAPLDCENCCWGAARFCLPRPPLFFFPKRFFHSLAVAHLLLLLPIFAWVQSLFLALHHHHQVTFSPHHKPPALPLHVLGSPLFSASPLFPPRCTRLRCSLRFLRSSTPCLEHLGASRRLRPEISPYTGVSSFFQPTWRALRRMSSKG